MYSNATNIRPDSSAHDILIKTLQEDEISFLVHHVVVCIKCAVGCITFNHYIKLLQ